MKSIFTLILILTNFWVSAQTKPLDKQLISSIKQSAHHKVDSLIKLGADIHTIDSTSATTLMIAAYESDVEMVKLLVKHGADAKKKGLLPVHRTTKNFYYGSVLTAAAGEGKTSIVEYLIDSLKIAVDERELTPDGSQGMTALMRACEWGKQRCIEYLIEVNADVNISSNRLSPLFLLLNSPVLDSQKEDLSLLFLPKIKNYQDVDTSKKTIFHHLTFQYKLIDYLLKNSTFSTLQDNENNTPLHYIVASENFVLAKELINKGYPTNIKNSKGETASDLIKDKRIKELLFDRTVVPDSLANWQYLMSKTNFEYSQNNIKEASSLFKKAVIKFQNQTINNNQKFDFYNNAANFCANNDLKKDGFIFLQKADSLLSIEKIVLAEALTFNLLKAQYYNEKKLYTQVNSILNYTITASTNLLGSINEYNCLATNLKGMAAYYQGKLDLAIYWQEQSMKVRKDFFGKKSRYYGSALNNSAFLNMEAGNYLQAKRLFEESITIKEMVANGKFNQSIAGSYNQLAGLYTYMGLFDESEKLLFSAINKTEKYIGKKSETYANLLNTYSKLLSSSGRLTAAEKMLVESIEIQASIDSSSKDFIVYIANLANFYLRVNDDIAAKKISLESLIIKKKYKHLHNLSAETVLHSIYSKQKEYHKVDSLFTTLLNVKNKNNDYYTLLWQQSLTLIARQKYLLADSLLNEAIRGCENAKLFNDEYFQMIIDRSTFLLSQKNTFEASKNIEKLTQFLKSDKLSYSGVPIDFNIIKIKIALQNSDYTSVDSLLNVCINRIPRIMYSQTFTLTQNQQTDILNKFQNKLDFIFSFINNSNLSENTKKGLVELSGFVKSYVLNNTQVVLKKMRNDLNEENKQSYKHLRQLFDQMNSPLLTLKVKEEKYQEWLQLYKSLVWKIDSEEEKKSVKNQRIKDNELLIDITHFKYHNGKKWTDSTLYCASVVHPKWSSPKTVVLFEEKQLQLYLEQSKTSEDDKTVNEIYNSKNQFLNKYIYQKLAPFLTDVQTIYISPSGLLNRVAFGAIPIDKKLRIVDKFVIKQITSPRELEKKTDDKSISEWKNITLYGGVRYDSDSLKLVQILEIDNKKTPLSNLALRGKTRGGSWDSLNNSRLEIQHIKTIFSKTTTNITTKTDFFANEESVKKLGKFGNSPEIIHFATHGFSYAPQERIDSNPSFESTGNIFKNSENPLLRSGIILAGANRVWSGKPPFLNIEDGILTSMEISNLDLSNTKLVVMSACESALGDIKGNEGVFGLQRAFKMAGVKYTISSLWRIPDKETAEFMTNFYSNLAQKQDIETAFNNTQKTMRNKYSPYYWAAFVLVK